jgi:hypothetical protein
MSGQTPGGSSENVSQRRCTRIVTIKRQPHDPSAGHPQRSSAVARGSSGDVFSSCRRCRGVTRGLLIIPTLPLFLGMLPIEEMLDRHKTGHGGSEEATREEYADVAAELVHVRTSPSLSAADAVKSTPILNHRLHLRAAPTPECQVATDFR